MKDIVKTLGNPTVQHVNVAGTGMPGVFIAGNKNSVLVPAIIFDRELEQLRKIGLHVTVLDTRHTCLGNNIACTDNGAIISTDFSEEERVKIEEALQVPTVQSDIAGLNTPGAFIVTNNGRGIIHRDANEDEIRLVEETLKITSVPATVNLGTPYLRAAIINNAHGFIIGDASGGPEIVHIDESLGYSDAQ